MPCLAATRRRPRRPRTPLTAWLRRPIAPPGNVYIDQTYRYGSTMGGNFQQHQGVEFNNPDGTPVHAALGGDGGLRRAGGAGRAHGRHPPRHHRHRRGTQRFRLYSIYYHN